MIHSDINAISYAFRSSLLKFFPGLFVGISDVGSKNTKKREL